jgi:hypothetical protein
MIPLPIEKIIQFDDISTTWNLVQISLDWNGHPLLLFEEGRPPFPFVASEELTRWYATTPTAHHIVYFDNQYARTITVPNSISTRSISFVQRFEDRWLLVEGRGGGAHIYDQSGSHLKSLNLGDAINDVQTTVDGQIWVSYFDEGVFGNGIGANGLVCFNSDGTPVFRFAEFAEKHNLSHIDDCYALNISSENAWLSYYSDFPLVQLKHFRLVNSWSELGSFSAFAIRGNTILSVPSYGGKKIVEINLDTLSKQEFDPIDDSNSRIANFKGRLYKERFANVDTELLQYYKPFQASARGPEIYLFTETTLFRVP